MVSAAHSIRNNLAFLEALVADGWSVAPWRARSEP
jgi:hypothetical protein